MQLDIPEAEVQLLTPGTHPRYTRSGYAWFMPSCPFCTRLHIHSAGFDPLRVSAHLGAKNSECSNGRYLLVWDGSLAERGRGGIQLERS